MSTAPACRAPRYRDRQGLATWATLRRGLDLSPELRAASASRSPLAPCCRPSAASLVPFVVQQTTDDGILADGGPDMASCCGYVGSSLAAAVA